MNDSKPSLIWALYVAGIAAVLTPFIAVGLAYFWRRTAGAAAREMYDTQIKVFWNCALMWLIALVVVAVGFATDTSVNGAGIMAFFVIGLLIVACAQLWFTVRALIGLIKCIMTPSTPPMATA